MNYEELVEEYNYAIAALNDESTESDYREIQFLKELIEKFKKPS